MAQFALPIVVQFKIPKVGQICVHFSRYQRKVSEGKNEMLVINNVCNKLVHRIFACVSRREKYNENYIQSFAWIIEIGPIWIAIHKEHILIH